MAHRKTVALTDLLATLNKRIRLCPDMSGRAALCSLLESVLMGANVYAGYGNIHEDDSFVTAKEIQTPGWSEDYRRHYYTHSRLTRSKPLPKPKAETSNPWPLK